MCLVIICSLDLRPSGLVLRFWEGIGFIIVQLLLVDILGNFSDNMRNILDLMAVLNTLKLNIMYFLRNVDRNNFSYPVDANLLPMATNPRPWDKINSF